MPRGYDRGAFLHKSDRPPEHLAFADSISADGVVLVVEPMLTLALPFAFDLEGREVDNIAAVTHV